MKLKLMLASLALLGATQAANAVELADMAPPGMPMGPGGPGPEHRPGPEGHGPGLPFLHGLKLTEAQQDKLFEIMHAAAPQIHEQEKALRRAHEGMRAMLQGAFDEAKAKALSDAEGKAIAALSLQRARTHAQVLSMLTPEQKAQLEAPRQPMLPPHR